MQTAVLTEDERMRLTRGVVSLLEDWGLQARQMIEVLDMPASVKVRNFSRFKNDTPFPDDPKVMLRVEYLLRIAEALRTMHPRSVGMRSRWMKQGHRRFGKRAPVEVMLEGGEQGMVMVLSELDCTFAWDQTGSKG